MPLNTYSTGTVAISSGGVVTVSTGIWTGPNVVAGDMISVAGAPALLINDVTDATHGQLVGWSGGSVSGKSYVVYKCSSLRWDDVKIAEDAKNIVAATNVQGYPVIVPDAASAPDPSLGNENQPAIQFNSWKWWKKESGLWNLKGSPAGLLPANALSEIAALGKQADARSNIGAQASLGFTAVNKAGDTMSGPLKLKIGNATYAVIPLEIGWGTEAGSRWRIGLTTTHVLQWGRYDSANTWISTPVEMSIDYTRFAHATAAANANVLRLGWANTSYAHWQWWLLTGGGMSLAYHSPSTGIWQNNAFNVTSTSVAFDVPISKPSGTFLIDHPLYPFEKDLAHAFVEAPRNELTYRGVASLVAGRAMVDIDAASNMSAGTFAALTTNARVMALQNQDGFARLRPGAIAGGTFEIICEDDDCADSVAWMVVAERNDPYVREIDPNCYRDGPNKGRFIAERDKLDADDGEPT